MKSAALGLQCAMTLGWIGLQFSIDLPDSGNGLFGVATGVGSFVGVTFAHEVEREKGLNMELRNSEIRN